MPLRFGAIRLDMRDANFHRKHKEQTWEMDPYGEEAKRLLIEGFNAHADARQVLEAAPSRLILKAYREQQPKEALSGDVFTLGHPDYGTRKMVTPQPEDDAYWICLFVDDAGILNDPPRLFSINFRLAELRKNAAIMARTMLDEIQLKGQRMEAENYRQIDSFLSNSPERNPMAEVIAGT